MSRCEWANGHAIYEDYHDTEWGVPLHDDTKLFEAIILDGFQAGLSWLTILRKRENFRQAFDGFDAKIIATYDDAKRAALLQDEGIIRNRLKVEAATTNAKAFLAVQAEFGSFDKYIWQFTDHKTIVNQWQRMDQIPVSTPESDAMSKDMKARGFKFVGTTICYAFMQAVGMVNDHAVTCPRHAEVQR
jgi:DNA-3-methyladenine glycosylase I